MCGEEVGEMGKQGGKAVRGAGGRGEEDRGKMLKLEVTGSEITYASCLNFFSVFAVSLLPDYGHA